MGNIFTPRIDPEPRPLTFGERVERHQMELPDKDMAKVQRRKSGYRGTVTDLLTGRRWKVYGAPCSLPNCMCDAVVKPEGGFHNGN